jgi:DNA-binding MarR family transcriptional regulator
MPTLGFDFSKAPGHLVRRLHQISIALFAKETAAFDVTAVQFAILQVLLNAPSADQVTVAEAVALDAATSGAVIARLESKGWLERVTDPADKRRKRLQLTALGQQAAQNMTAPVSSLQKQLLTPLSVAEQKEWLRLMDKLVQGHAAKLDD